MTVQEYQQTLSERLARFYSEVRVQTEWAAMTDEVGMYSPRLDVAVGPFATHTTCVEQYNQLMDDSRPFICRMVSLHCENIAMYNGSAGDVSFEQLKYKNTNARCFLAIEIENKVSRKHLMGGAINAAALGRIGLAVAYKPDKLKAFIKLRAYLNFLASVGKNTFDTSNLLILSAEQLLECIENDFENRYP
jgi:hypothetical protein